MNDIIVKIRLLPFIYMDRGKLFESFPGQFSVVLNLKGWEVETSKIYFIFDQLFQMNKIQN